MTRSSSDCGAFCLSTVYEPMASRMTRRSALQHGLLGGHDIARVRRDGHGGERRDDDHDDHQFQQGKAGGEVRGSGFGGSGGGSPTARDPLRDPRLNLTPELDAFHHVLYLMPSIAVPSLLV